MNALSHRVNAYAAAKMMSNSAAAVELLTRGLAAAGAVEWRLTNIDQPHQRTTIITTHIQVVTNLMFFGYQEVIPKTPRNNAKAPNGAPGVRIFANPSSGHRLRLEPATPPRLTPGEVLDQT